MRGSEHSGAVRAAGISRSGYYYHASPETPENLALMRRLDELHLEHPVYGSRRLRELLRREGLVVNRKRVSRLLQIMGIEAIYPRPFRANPKRGIGSVRTCWKGWKSRVEPSVVRGHHLCTDGLRVHVPGGGDGLVEPLRAGLELSNSQEAEFCVRAWEASLELGHGVPLISNTDQGSQFTSEAFLDAVESAGTGEHGRTWALPGQSLHRGGSGAASNTKTSTCKITGTAWRPDAAARWFGEYNNQRPHQALNYATPAQYYLDPDGHGARPAVWA